LPLFSGAWLRIIFFAVIYCLLLLFVRRYARKVESDPSRSPVYQEDLVIREEGAETVEISETEDVSRTPVKPVGSGMRKAIIWFAGAMLLAIVFILVTGRIASLSRYAFPAMSVLFFIGGIGSGLFAGMGIGRVFSTFGRGGLRILPAVLIILMAYSVKLIIDNGGITDTILYQAGQAITGSGTYVSALMIYLVTLGMNFFIGSASAKAFLMMPILTPLADLVDVTRQTAVLAFDFGDGFSNMIYPSNPLLLIALGLTVVSYPKWLKWTAALQGVVFLITLVFLWIAVMIGYGPA
ncbi:MAG: AbgT family transporter, partial [Spirochaetales bacterium]|nr:AbgT family transporter [Spirochaetales bacterium]MCF7939725.1 AbgT family transporter [Spirochaetales bacterium]